MTAAERPAPDEVKVLIVDDEPQIRRALSLNLRARGYDVLEATSGEEALPVVAESPPDVVLLDLALTGLDGVAVIQAVRGWSNLPIIVLTVRDDEHSKVIALDSGADDYITKPFGIAELLARIRAVLRRRPSADDEQPDVTSAHFRLDLAARRAFVGRDETEVRLTPTEWAMAVHLARQPDRLVTYKQLVTAVWGNDDPDQSLLRVHMGHIRRKLEPDPVHPRYFVTDSGVGYRYQPDAVPVGPAATAEDEKGDAMTFEKTRPVGPNTQIRSA